MIRFLGEGYDDKIIKRDKSSFNIVVCVYEMKEQFFRENMKKWNVKFEDCNETKMYL